MERRRAGVLAGCLVSSGLAFACASPPDAGDSLDDGARSSTRRDGGRGTGGDAGRDAGKRDARAEQEARSDCSAVQIADREYDAVPCDCDDGRSRGCVQLCEAGEPSGACKTLTAHAADLGTPDDQDGGSTRTDAGATTQPPMSASAGECPANFMCSNEGGLAVIAQGAGSTGMCAVSRGMPLACSTVAECSKVGLAASCYDLASNGFPGIAGMLGLPNKFCAAPCNL